MRLYTYALRFDTDAAPNPYGGVCTLTICKPAIRRTAHVGDWVVGLGPKNAPDGRDLSRHVVYAMLVSRKMTYAEYDSHCSSELPVKIPDWSATAPFERQVGDCIYEPIPGTHWFKQRRGIHNKDDIPRDTSGLNALLAEYTFFYFGRAAVPLPSKFHRISHPHPSHKVHLNDDCKDDVVEWMLGGFGRDLRPGILYGEPLHRGLLNPAEDPVSCSMCAKDRLLNAAEEEESIC